MTRAAPLLPSVTVTDALACVLRECASMPPLPTEELDLGQARQRVLAEPLSSPWAMPAADVSMMDGWAVRCGDLRAAPSGAVVLRASPGAAAGHPPQRPLARGEAGRVFTGAVLPEGADAVIPQEDVEFEDGTGTEAGPQIRVDPEARAQLAAGRFVRLRGSEIAQGERVADPGTRLGAGELAALASCGHARVVVRQRPRVAVLSTGDELVRLGQRPGPGQIVSSNGLMLAAQVTEAGGEALVLPEVADDPAALRAALVRGLAADILLTSGGISVGDHDLVRAQLESLGVEVHLHGLALRPGKPTAFGTCGNTLVFALPGNPASAWVAFTLLVLPALLARSGDGSPRPPLKMRVQLTAAIHGTPRRAHYVRARWATGTPPRATPLPAQRSGNLRSIGGVDLLLIVPVGVETIAAGEPCEAIIVRPPPEPAR